MVVAVDPQRIEKPVAHRAIGAGGRHHRCIDESSEVVCRRSRRLLLAGGHGLARRQIERVAKDAEPIEQPLMFWWQEVVAPIERRGQAGMTPVHCATVGAQQAKPIVEVGRDLGRRQEVGAGGCHLDGQGQAVQIATDPCDVGGVFRRRRETRVDLGGSFAEEPFGVRRSVVGEGHCHGRNLVAGFSGHHERAAAGGQQLEVRCGFEERCGEPGNRFRHVLAVVEDQQRLAFGQIPRQQRGGVCYRLVGQVERLRDLHRHRRFGHHRSQIDPPDSMGESFEEDPPCLRGEPGLAHATNTHQSDQPVGVDRLADLSYLSSPT